MLTNKKNNGMLYIPKFESHSRKGCGFFIL